MVSPRSLSRVSYSIRFDARLWSMRCSGVAVRKEMYRYVKEFKLG